MTVDYLFHHAIVVTMADTKGCGLIEDGAVAVMNNRIVAVGETKELEKQYPAHRYIDGTGKVVMPGLVDAHMHTGVSIYKGLAQDSQNWMNDCVFPLKEALDPASTKAGSMVMIAEALKAGTTTFVDTSDVMDILAENHMKAGTRASIAQTVHALPKDLSSMPRGELYTLDRSREEQSYKANMQLIERYHEHCNGRITCFLNPLGPDRITREMLLEIGELSRKIGCNIHMHLSCGEREIDQMCKRYGKRSIPFLDELGLIDERMVGVHLSVATPEEVRHFARLGAAMVLCSGSEAIVDGNVPPAYEFSRYSDRLAIGSDQTSGGNTSNMFNEMKIGALLNKCKYHDPEVFQAWKMLRLATIDGARTIGMGNQVGSLEKGKKADIIMVNMMLPHMTPLLFDPLRNIIPNLVYAANGSEVVLSMIDGKIVMEERQLITIDEGEVIRQANIEGKKLIQRAGTALFAHETAMNRMMKENKL